MTEITVMSGRDVRESRRADPPAIYYDDRSDPANPGWVLRTAAGDEQLFARDPDDVEAALAEARTTLRPPAARRDLVHDAREAVREEREAIEATATPRTWTHDTTGSTRHRVWTQRHGLSYEVSSWARPDSDATSAHVIGHANVHRAEVGAALVGLGDHEFVAVEATWTDLGTSVMAALFLDREQAGALLRDLRDVLSGGAP